jgi:hypothetical protein
MAILVVGYYNGVLAPMAKAQGDRWVITEGDGFRLGGGDTGIPEFHASEAECKAYKDGVVARARAVAQRRSGAATSPLAETWNGARCVHESTN